MTRHKRRSRLSEAEIGDLIYQAEIFHAALCGHMHVLKPQDETYRHLLALDMAIESAVFSITGLDPPWCRIGPGFMAGT